LEDEFSTSIAVAGLIDLWDPYLLDWLVKVRKHEPLIAIHAAAFSSQVLMQQILNGQLDLAFLFEPQSSPELNTRFIKRLNLQMVSTIDKQSVNEALENNYVMIDWGTAYTVNHARLFPDIPSSPVFMSHGSLALSFLLKNGGSAYLPEEWTAPLIKKGILYPVENSPVLERDIHVVWRADNEKNAVIKDILIHF
jgi:DNA-binding transcriptional LysR family regulator